MISRVLFLFFLLVLGCAVRPLFAGSLELDDKILRLNQCIFRNITLPITKKAYESNGKIAVVGAISQMAMNQRFAFQFRYEILCPMDNCFIDFVLSRFTERVSEDFEYRLVIDFLVGEGIEVDSLNMTYNRADFSVDRIGEDGRSEEWEMFLLPNGWNNVSLTGTVGYAQVEKTNKFAISSTKGEDEGLVEWPLNKNFVLYSVVLVPKAQTLPTVQSECKNSLTFSGFLSTKSQKIDFNLHSYQATNTIQRLSLPLECMDFPDQRKALITKPSLPPSQSLTYIFFIIPLLIAQLAYILYKKKNRGQSSSHSSVPSLLISFEASHATIDPKQCDPQIPPESSQTTQQA